MIQLATVAKPEFSPCPPEQNFPAPGGPTGWIEPYKVRRGEKDFWYHRYCWQEGRAKIHHRHIKKGKLRLIERAIELGLSPAAIQRLLK